MAEALRFLPVGGDALLAELPDLAAALALADALANAPPEGLTEFLPAARTVLLRFDPARIAAAALAKVVAGLDIRAPRPRPGRRIEIPVHYDGEDLPEVAALLGLPVEEVIRRHLDATFTVAFTGFAPGFAYLTCSDPLFDLPRRKSPRSRIPAGALALGGRFCGIYPADTPGGWQIIGRTPLAMWDPGRADRPALLAPGDTVVFRDIARGATLPAAAPALPRQPVAAPDAGLLVTRGDRPALFQDLGRPGCADQGVAESGALDRASLVQANLLLGNPPGAAALEVTHGGFALRADRPLTVAVTGAPCPLHLDTADGRRIAAPFARPFAIDSGEVLELGAPDSGSRSYLALRGGFALPRVLGSSATDTLARLGPDPVGAGAVLVPAGQPAGAVDPCPLPPTALPRAGDVVTLDIHLGPRSDWFSEGGLAVLLQQEFVVTPAVSRTGLRLEGAAPIARRDDAELPSEATVAGAIQVPHDGQPVLFLRDHPLTGGYPVIAVVARHHLDLAGQLPIGARIRFRALAPFAPLVAPRNRPALPEAAR